MLRRRSEAGKALPATRPAKQPADLLAADPQLSGALLLMRLELAGGRLIEPAPAQARAQIPTAGADAVNAK